jgi:hypothetical protein
MEARPRKRWVHVLQKAAGIIPPTAAAAAPRQEHLIRQTWGGPRCCRGADAAGHTASLQSHISAPFEQL